MSMKPQAVYVSRPEQKDYCVGLEAEYFAREKGGIMIG